jgi:hypothetical protein
MTGLHIGGVGFTAELHDSRPVLDETWEEIVEVPFRPVSEETKLRQWNWKKWWSWDWRCATTACVSLPPVWTPAGVRTSGRTTSLRRMTGICCSSGLPRRTGQAAQADQPCGRVLARLRHFARGLTA